MLGASAVLLLFLARLEILADPFQLGRHHTGRGGGLVDHLLDLLIRRPRLVAEILEQALDVVEAGRHGAAAVPGLFLCRDFRLAHELLLHLEVFAQLVQLVRLPPQSLLVVKQVVHHVDPRLQVVFPRLLTALVTPDRRVPRRSTEPYFAVYPGLSQRRPVVVVQSPGYSKVVEVDGRLVASLPDGEILRLDVTVDEANLVEVLDGFERLEIVLLYMVATRIFI